MKDSKKNDAQQKNRLHPRNRNRNKYDLSALTVVLPELSDHIKPNKHGEDSVNFSNPEAVKMLNTAILNHYYGIKNWNFPDKNLCPPIPGRADYIHYIADLLGMGNDQKIPKGEDIVCLDVGVGASCIYPIIGVTEYGWNFIGSDTDPASISSAEKIIKFNATLKNKIECRKQGHPDKMFQNIILQEEKIDVVICNPPFHDSAQAALKSTRRKVKNLTGKKEKYPQLNFSGIKTELIYEGGEYKFIHNMITESLHFAQSCLWFSVLVSKKSNLNGLYKALKKVEASQVKTIEMGTGNKVSRILAWTFHNEDTHRQWRDNRWKI